MHVFILRTSEAISYTRIFHTARNINSDPNLAIAHKSDNYGYT